MATALAAPPQPGLIEAAQLHADGNLLQAANAYRRLLQSDPRCTPACLGLSLIALQSGQPMPALSMVLAALASDRDSAPAWLQLGQVLTLLNQPSHAESAFTRSLVLAPGLPAAHFGLGNLHALREDFSAALACFERALALNPAFPEYHFAQAFSLAKLGQQPQAIAAYRQAVTLRPSFAAAWVNLGVSLIADGRAQLAQLCYLQAIQANPRQLSAHLNLGNLERSRMRFPQARAHYDAALAVDNQNSDVHVALAYWHLEQQQFPEAHQSLCDAAQASPRNPEIFNARGVLLLAQSSTPQCVLTESVEAIQSAIAAFQEAESLGHKTAASNRGNALLRLGRLPEALAAHESAVARDPHHPGARYNLALTQLRLGDFAQGWPNYEIRWSFRDLHPHPRRFPAPRWDGHPPAERTSPRLFLYAEQGLGDTLQFVRYLPQIAAMGFKITLEIQPPLSRLLQPFVSNLGGELIPHGAAIPPFDLHCPLLSLPAVFSTTIETIPAQIPYLHPASNLQSPRPNPQSIRIGLAWAGNPNYRADYERSTHLKTFLPLLELPNIQFVSLQKGPAAAQIAEIARQFNPQSNRQPNLDDACSRDRDLADTAAVLAGLDLVITTDTVIAHLAGAMGKPLWILLPWQSDWRWMQDRLDTPWYPQARLFRQTTPGGWPGLVSQVRAELAAFASKTPLTRPATGSSATPGQPL